jgi:hypothetical protein
MNLVVMHTLTSPTDGGTLPLNGSLLIDAIVLVRSALVLSPASASRTALSLEW